MCARRRENRSIPPSSKTGPGGVALGPAQAGRGRGRHRQQRRAAARGVFPPHPPPHERVWRIVAAPDEGRRAALSGFQGNWCSEARETTAGSVLEKLFFQLTNVSYSGILRGTVSSNLPRRIRRNDSLQRLHLWPRRVKKTRRTATEQPSSRCF
jgi:hypothetical protein